jgi:hypothetical protein
VVNKYLLIHCGIYKIKMNKAGDSVSGKVGKEIFLSR